MLKFIFRLVYDAVCIALLLTIAHLLAFNYFFYEVKVNEWINGSINLLFTLLMSCAIICGLYYFWRKERTFMTLKNKISYLTLFLLQGMVFYPLGRSFRLQYHLDCDGGLSAIVGILGNIVLLFILTVVLMLKGKNKFPAKFFNSLTKTHIVSLLIFAPILFSDGLRGNYVEVIDDIILLYYVFSIKAAS